MLNFSLLRIMAISKRIAQALERQNELKEIELGLRTHRLKSSIKSSRKSSVDFSVASVEERNRAWKLDRNPYAED